MSNRRVFIDVKRKKSGAVQVVHKGCFAMPGHGYIKTQQKSAIVKFRPGTESSDIHTLNFPRLEHPFWHRTKELTVFLVIGLVIVTALNLLVISKYGLETKDNLTLAAYEGLSQMREGVKLTGQAKLKDANRAFGRAITKFSDAEKELWFLSKDRGLEKSQIEPIGSANAVLQSGRYLSEAGKIFTETAGRLTNIPDRFLGKAENPTIEPKNILSLQTEREKLPSITDPIRQELPNIQKSFDALQKAEASIGRVDENLIPKNLQKEFTYGKTLLSSLTEDVQNIKGTLPGLLTLLGDKRPHRILVLLQNNAELRPTGGFIGSYTLLTFNDGYLTQNEFHDVYETDYQLKDFVPAPEEVQAVSKQWFLRDSNYSPDFSVSGEKAAWFLQKSKGPSVDSVIAIDQSLLKDLLKITGPVYVPSLNNFFTEDNFNIVLSYIIESKLTGKENPKAVLSEFMPIFQKQLFEKATIADLGKIFLKAISERHLMGYSREKDVEGLFQALHMDGKFEPVSAQNEDFLKVVHFSISGNKSDAYVQEKFTHDTRFKRNGQVEDTFTIEKTHTWDAENTANVHQILNSFGFANVSNEIKDIMGRGKNVTQTRIYVPKGARILEINDIPLEKIVTPKVIVKEDPDTHQTYFFARIETERGKPSKLKIRYLLPFRMRFDPTSEYHLKVEKQMGTRGASFIKNFSPDAPIQLLKSYSSCGENLKTDCSLGSIWE